MKNKLKKVFAVVMAAAMLLTCGGITAFAAENEAVEEQQPVVAVSFDLTDQTRHEATVLLDDGTTATVGAEPVATNSRSLSGTWRIYGYNALATMEYYIVLAPSGSYTTISSAYGLAITGTLSSFENERINIVRRTETSSKSAIVEGYAKFNYLGNQWVSIWTQSGGVRASIKNNVVTTELY